MAELQILRLTHREFDDLLEYSASLPTGTTIGKRWKRLDGAHDHAFIKSGGKPRWMVGEYTREVVKSDPIVIGDLPEDGELPLINLRCRIEVVVEITWYRPVIVVTAIAA